MTSSRADRVCRISTAEMPEPRVMAGKIRCRTFVPGSSSNGTKPDGGSHLTKMAKP
jgi:hypothetical protein